MNGGKFFKINGTIYIPVSFRTYRRLLGVFVNVVFFGSPPASSRFVGGWRIDSPGVGKVCEGVRNRRERLGEVVERLERKSRLRSTLRSWVPRQS